jgi:translation elongation factor EF-1beta
MQGVLVDLVIGAALFTPIGFGVAYLQHKKVMKQEEAEKESMKNQSTQSESDINNSFHNKNLRT